MKTEKIELAHDCYFEFDGYDVTLNYVEHSSDHYYSNTDTYIDIEVGDARKIIDFLQRNVIDKNVSV